MNDKINIIVIDAQKNYVNALNNYIDICDYEDKINVVYENKTESAIKEISKNPNSIVILDAYIDNGNSISLLQEIRSKDIEIVLVSDNPSNEIREAALKNGASAFFIKKYEPEDLDSIFEMIIKNGKKEDIIIN